MSLQNEPKSIEDYKDVVKILKLKIIKQNKRIQELQLKNKTYEEQINNVSLRGQEIQMSSRVMYQLQNENNLKREQKQLEMNTLKGKVEVMATYAKGLNKLGISTQSVFRIADFTYKNYVQSDYFRQVLVKIKLSLTQKEISCLIFIFDETYSGLITRDDYCNSLQAYKIAVQESNHPFIHQCISKFSQILHSQKVNLIKYYEEMQGRSKSKLGQTNKKIVDLNVFEQQIKKTLGSRLSQRQIIACFNAIDLQSQEYLEKSNFLYTITSYINKLLTAQQNHSKKSHAQWNNSKSNLIEQFYSGTPKKNDKAIQNINQTPKIGQGSNEPSSTKPQSCVTRMQRQFAINLSQVYDQLISYDFSNRLTLKAFKKLCSKLNKLSSQFVSQLYKEIDSQYKGSLFFNQLINYYIAHSNDNQMVLRLLGKYFQVSDLDSEKFWFMFGLSSDSEISKNKFIQILRKNFETKDEKEWENFWSMFDKGKGTCNVGSIIKIIKKYQS